MSCMVTLISFCFTIMLDRNLFYLKSPAFGCLSKYYEYTVAKQNYEYRVAKQNGDGAEWVELFIMLTKGMDEPTYGL